MKPTTGNQLLTQSIGVRELSRVEPESKELSTKESIKQS